MTCKHSVFLLKNNWQFCPFFQLINCVCWTFRLIVHSFLHVFLFLLTAYSIPVYQVQPGKSAWTLSPRWQLGFLSRKFLLVFLSHCISPQMIHRECESVCHLCGTHCMNVLKVLQHFWNMKVSHSALKT